jgi:hypothetical protein
MVTDFAGPGTKNDCTGEGRQKFTRKAKSVGITQSRTSGVISSGSGDPQMGDALEDREIPKWVTT